KRLHAGWSPVVLAGTSGTVVDIVGLPRHVMVTFDSAGGRATRMVAETAPLRAVRRARLSLLPLGPECRRPCVRHRDVLVNSSSNGRPTRRHQRYSFRIVARPAGARNCETFQRRLTERAAEVVLARV